MLGTKIEIQMPKAEPGSWSALNFPPKSVSKAKSEMDEKKEEEEDVPKVDALDLDDLELGSGSKFVLSPEASMTVN